MRVTAAEGLRVPVEGNPRQYIEHNPAEPVEVPDTSYYRRRLLAKELVEVVASPTEVATEAEPQTAVESAKPAAKAKKGASE